MQPLLKRTIERLRLYRYKWFGRAPSPREWEARVDRAVQDTVIRSLPWIPDEGGSFLDIGANIGAYTQKILQARPTARAWLFEPVRTHYERCVERFADRPNVVVENLGLGDRSERTTIWKAKHNPGGNAIEAQVVDSRRGYVDFTPEEIVCRAFDDYAREKKIARVDFIKSDTEGYDYRVLRGMLGFLARCDPKPALLIELWREGIHPDYPAQMAVLEELYRLGYGAVDLSSMQDVEDFLFVPAGSAGRAGPESPRGPQGIGGAVPA